MSYRLNNEWRGNRNYQIGSFPPVYGTMHYSIANYCTDKRLDGISTESNKKSELNETLTSETYLAQLQSLSNPLQKNLADTLPNLKAENTKNITANYRHSRQKSFDFAVHETKMPVTEESRVEYSTFSGIGSFISNVFNVISQAMPFQKRPRRASIVNLLESDAPRDSSPPLVTWPKSNLDIQNKNKTQSQTHNHTIDINEENTKMNKECLSAASQCEGKLATVRLLLANKVAATKPVPVKARRPRRIFVPPNSVEKVFDDAFNQEDCEQLPSSHSLEHVSPTKNVVQHFVKLNGPKINIQAALDVNDVNKPLKDTENKTKQIDCDKEFVNEECNQDTGSELTINNVVNPEILVNDEGFTQNETSVVNLPTISDTASSDKLPEDPNCLKTEVVASCEDKVNQLKAMLLERKLNTKNKSNNERDTEKQHEKNKKHKMHSKKYKNPNRLTDKRQKCYQNRIIKEDMSFANELDSEIASSLDNSPKPEVNKQLSIQNSSLEMATSKTSINSNITENLSKTLTIQESPVDCIFDEVSGRFRNSSTTESEDSFQIVFTDKLKPTSRSRKLSDCDSEDSFIVFEDSPDSCYTSTDIFGNSDEETDTSSSDCDSDSGNEVCQLNHAFSRTVSDLTDCSLYETDGFPKGSVCLESEDEVDSAVKLGEVIQSDLVVDRAALVKDSATIAGDDETPVEDSATPVEDSATLVEDTGLVSEEVVVPKKTGLLLTDEKKCHKRLEGPKKVRFSQAPPKVHVMRVWQFAARQARAGHWERHALDRERFQRRIADVDMAISWVLKPQHRSRVKFQRFMPWWHAERRKEAAEKKLREEQEKIQRELEEKLRIEEEERKKEEEDRMIAEALTRIDSINVEVSNDETPHKDASSVRDNSIVNDNDIDKKELMIITNKCLLNVDSINEIKMQISNEVKQLLASSDDEFKSSSSDMTKRKISNTKRNKSINKKRATVCNENVTNDHVNLTSGNKNVSNDHGNVTSGYKKVTNDHGNVTSGNKNVANDHKNVKIVLACSDTERNDVDDLPNTKLL